MDLRRRNSFHPVRFFLPTRSLARWKGVPRKKLVSPASFNLATALAVIKVPDKQIPR